MHDPHRAGSEGRETNRPVAGFRFADSARTLIPRIFPTADPPSATTPPVRILPLLAFALLCPVPMAAQGVSAENGGIVYRASGASAPRRLTSSGRDSQPRLSPDGRMVAFVRATPDDRVQTAAGEAEATELWIVGADGSGARMLVRGRASADPRQALAAFGEPQFSPDGRQVWFLSAAWATSGAVHAIDVATGRERFVVAGNSLEVVPRGEYAGHLMVEQHRYFLAGGSYDWVWLFTPDGREVGPVGATDEALAEFRSSWGN